MTTAATDLSTSPTMRYRFTVDEYYRMAASGILPETGRTELLDGEIYAMRPVNSPHAGMVNKLTRFFTAHLDASQYLLSVQNPVRLNAHSEPEPDLAVLRFLPDFYQSAHPGPSDILLLVEVADASLEKDRQVKLPLYARAGIPEVWLVNLAAGHIEVCRRPLDNVFLDQRVYSAQDTLVSGLLGECPASQILG